MSKRIIPDDTENFKYFNNNPKGLHQSDCIVRAVANVLIRDYCEVCKDLSNLQCETGLADVILVDKYMQINGYIKMRQPHHGDGRCYRGREFVSSIYTAGHRRILANIGQGHITSIVDGKINDIWDCSDKVIGNYWIEADPNFKHDRYYS